MKLDKKELLLYAVTDRSRLNGKALYDQVEQALKGGVTFIQLREKELDEHSFLKEAVEIKKLCQSFGVPFIINDNLEIALKTDSDGIHVGQSDMNAGDVRKLIGRNKILGVSAQTAEQAIYAEKQGADYLGVGAVFHTDSKSDAEYVSYDTLKQICEAVNIPVIAIGGIGIHNILELKGSGICGVAVISAVFGSNNIYTDTAMLKSLAEQMVTE